MALHYGRDALINGWSGYWGQYGERWALVFALLRAGGAEWLWECDGEVGPCADNPNHVQDGNMEAAGTGSYLAVGTGAIAKSTTVKHVGTQSLKITSNALNDGARTVALQSISNGYSASFTANDWLQGPAVNEMMSIYDDAAPFQGEPFYVGCRITIAGEGAAGNNGTFVVTKWNSSSVLQYHNPSGVAKVPPTPPSGNYTLRVPYEIVLWASNNSGTSWNVSVDQGDGSPASVGNIPHNGGVWTRYHFSFETLSNGSRYIYVTCPSATVGLELYLDSVQVFRSVFEYHRVNASGADGELINPDQFKSAWYHPSAKDVGRWLCVWDATNPNNTGWYKILGVAGVDTVQVDLRSGTAAFVASGPGLGWRIIAPEDQFQSYYHPDFIFSPGFGLKMPHASGWRFFMRAGYREASSTYFDWIWAAPTDEADFDQSTGAFYSNGPSTQRNREGTYKYGNYTTKLAHGTREPSNSGGGITTRTWMLTDDDMSFIDVVHNNPGGYGGHFLCGYMGADPTFPGVEEFALIARSADLANTGDEVQQSTAITLTSWYYGTGFNKQQDAVHVSIGMLGYDTVSDVKDQSNASDNPWSGEEIVYPLPLIRDPEGHEGCPAEREVNGIGLYMCRANLPTFAAFDSNGYYHFKGGFCWKWNGFAPIP